MKTVMVTFSLVIFSVIAFIVSFKGLDLRRGSSWFYGVISFLCGFVLIMGLEGNPIDGIKAGGIFAFVMLVSGVAMRWHKQRYEGMARSLLLQHGKSDDQTFFAKLVRSLLGKYK